MGLTEHERRELDAMERQLAEDDPAFATKLAKPSWHARLPGKALFVVGLLTTYVIGLTLVVTGATFSSWPVIVIGAAVTAVFPAKVATEAVREQASWRSRRPLG